MSEVFRPSVVATEATTRRRGEPNDPKRLKEKKRKSGSYK